MIIYNFTKKIIHLDFLEPRLANHINSAMVMSTLSHIKIIANISINLVVEKVLIKIFHLAIKCHSKSCVWGEARCSCKRKAMTNCLISNTLTTDRDCGAILNEYMRVGLIGEWCHVKLTFLIIFSKKIRVWKNLNFF